MDIIPIEMFDGDPGYFVRGHVDKTEFATAVNTKFNEEFTAREVEHVYQTTVRPIWLPPGKFDKPSRTGDGDNFWWLCKAEDEAAFPCTFVRP